MSAQDLSFGQLVTATDPFVTGAFATWWRSHLVGQLYAGKLDGLRAIVISAPSGSSEIERLTEAIAEEDGVHDEALRFGCGYLDTYADHYHLPEVRNAAREMKALLMPDGIELVNKSLEEEVSRADARDVARTPEVRAILVTFKMPEAEGGPAHFDAWLDEVLQPSTRRLGALLQERKRLLLVSGSGGLSAEELFNAKRGLIRLVRQIFSSFAEAELAPEDRAKVDEARAAWDAEVRKATELGDARRRARKAAEEKKKKEGPGDPA